jgi:hypothetical protein
MELSSIEPGTAVFIDCVLELHVHRAERQTGLWGLPKSCQPWGGVSAPNTPELADSTLANSIARSALQETSVQAIQTQKMYRTFVLAGGCKAADPRLMTWQDASRVPSQQLYRRPTSGYSMHIIEYGTRDAPLL